MSSDFLSTYRARARELQNTQSLNEFRQDRLARTMEREARKRADQEPPPACALEVDTDDLSLREIYGHLPESALCLAKNWREVPGHNLTLNECCVLVCAAACLNYVEIANIRGISKQSVRDNFKRINYKLRADTIMGAVSVAVAKGIIIPSS